MILHFTNTLNYVVLRVAFHQFLNHEFKKGKPKNIYELRMPTVFIMQIAMQ